MGKTGEGDSGSNSAGSGEATVMERKRRSGTRTASQRETEDAVGVGEAVKRERRGGSVIQYHDVTAASFRIRKGVKQTPLKVRRH